MVAQRAGWSSCDGGSPLSTDERLKCFVLPTVQRLTGLIPDGFDLVLSSSVSSQWVTDDRVDLPHQLGWLLHTHCGSADPPERATRLGRCPGLSMIWTSRFLSPGSTRPDRISGSADTSSCANPADGCEASGRLSVLPPSLHSLLKLRTMEEPS